MRVCCIASGSSGNCTYVGTDTAHILIDAGLSGKKTREGVESLDITLDDIDGIFLTHEHSDHIKGLGIILRKHDIPVYGTPGTIKAIENTQDLGEYDHSLLHTIEPDEKFILKDINLRPVNIAHDAAQPVGYRIESEGRTFGMITDIGSYTDYTIENMRGVNCMMIEANHDVRMLETGRYPYPLKKRILSDHGHLSNEKAGDFLDTILNDQIESLIIGHLSQENNLPELAYEAVRGEIEMSESKYHANDFPLIVASRTHRSEVIEV